MKHLLIYFTKDLSFNGSFCEFVDRSLAKKNLFANTIIKLNDDDSKLNTLLEIDVKKYELVTIIADEHSFSMINKILATLKECELSLIDDEFIVENPKDYKKNSVLIDLNGVMINILKASMFYLPEILHNTKLSYDFLISDLDLESAEILLNTSVKPYGVSLNIYSLLDNLLYVKVNTNEYSDEIGLLNSVKSLFPKKVIFADNLYEHIIKKLKENNKKLSFAESCTGGLLASNFTKINGSSSVYEGSVITYSNKSKKAWLNVEDIHLENQAVYSQNCALAMATGVLKLTKANYAITCTGVLGDSDDLGVKSGVAFICAISDTGLILHERLELLGDRIYKQNQCALACALLLCKLEREVFFE
ncbi:MULTISPECIES: CinA family protein [unclassified Campylobacter]|uniref:CinA family protein n=1 Tax=unclassified Campylobacter TaxID=2593542 RepID=UPI001DF11314|nr:CinA family protein [Campylobacter sp. RM9331]MBZ8005801.1 CinA family protein [Campylobacter sp. RM9332]